MRNKTTLESFQKIHFFQATVRGWDLGSWRKNFEAVFGDKPKLWFVPVPVPSSRGHDCNGCDFPVEWAEAPNYVVPVRARCCRRACHVARNNKNRQAALLPAAAKRRHRDAMLIAAVVLRFLLVAAACALLPKAEARRQRV